MGTGRLTPWLLLLAVPLWDEKAPAESLIFFGNRDAFLLSHEESSASEEKIGNPC